MLTLSRARLRASALLLAAAGAFGVVGTAAVPAQAATLAASTINEAAHHRGQPYVWGAAGPTRFDCSGFTLYVFGRFGKRLPHNSSQQYSVVRHVAKSSMAPGDLVFFKNSSGRIYHVGLYAGSGYMWHSPKSGDVVKKSRIWTSSYVVGRV